MTISATTTSFKSARRDKIPNAELAYICRRNQQQAYDLMVQAVKASGLSQRRLSQLTGIDESALSRLLRRPRNIELNTLSKVLYAACGAGIRFELSFPNDNSK